MEIGTPEFSVDRSERARDCQSVFQEAVRELMVQAVRAGWRESEAALALADAAEDYVIYLAEKPKRHLTAANSN